MRFAGTAVGSAGVAARARVTRADAFAGVFLRAAVVVFRGAGFAGVSAAASTASLVSSAVSATRFSAWVATLVAFARAQVATLRAVFADVALLAEPGTLRGRRFGNLVAVASDAPLPVAALTRRCAGDPMPARVVDGADLDRFAGRARPVTDAAAQPSPEPPPGVFSR